jgi:alpha-mannosidase
LPRIGTEIEVETRVHWNEKDRLLKLSVPTCLKDCEYRGQVAFGVGKLPTNGEEAVTQKWIAVVSKKDRCALTCINDGVYGSDYSAAGLRITLLRSPAYSGHPIMNRPIMPQDRYSPRHDQGERLFRFWLNGGPTTGRLAAVDREALVHNENPFALSFNPPGVGRKPKAGVILSDNVVQVSAVKKSHKGNDLIVRLFEPTGRGRFTTVSIPSAGVRKQIELKGFEIRTLRIDPKTRQVREVDLLER